MVGGIVIGIARGSEDTLVHVQDKRDTCAVRCIEMTRIGQPVEIQLGDSLWWQCGWCMWTPKGPHGDRCGIDFDIQLPKVGYSHAIRHV